MTNETVFLGGCPVIQPEGIYLNGRRVIRLGLHGTGVGAPTVTWVAWYNSHASEQDSFDEAAKALDDPSTTPEQKQNYITFFGGSDDEKEALRNYVATGGRAALFAKPAQNYGPKPIAVAKPSGPIEPAPSGSGDVTLHPGTYTYSNVTSTGEGFDAWVQNNAKTVKNTVVQTSVSVLPGGASYYTDNLFVVYQDTLWPSTLKGLPTWLPPGTDPVKYWGKVTPPAPPDWGAIKPPQETLKWIGIAAAVAVVLVGGALVVYYVPRRQPPPPAPALPYG
jgi:hypothetical protein